MLLRNILHNHQRPSALSAVKFFFHTKCSTTFPAIYVGERQYRDPVYTGKFNGEYIKKLIEGWRIYGIDELHGCNDLYHRSFESRKLGYQKEGARLSWAYPDSPYSRGEAFSGFINLLYPDANEFELNELGKGYHASYRPVVVTCANQWDWAYFSGEEVEREIYVVNDNSGQRDMETEVIWELKEGAEIIKGGRDHLKVDPGANGVVKVKFGLPNVKERKELKWCLYLKEYEKVIDENAYDLEVFPLSYRDKPKIRSKIVLYDPEGESKKLLEQAGINYNEFKELKDFSGYDLLIIGEEAPRFEVEQARESIIDYVSKGGKVLIFKQRCALNITPAKMNVGTFQFNQTFPRAVEHPILKDLEENDFKMWRGYPHTVSVYPLHKPIFAANYKAMLHTGPNLDFTSLLEINHGEGLYLFSQLELSQRYGIDPVVTKLMNNIFEYLAGDRRIKWKIVGIYGGEQGILSRVIDKYKIIKDEDFSLKGIDILIIAPKAASIQTANHKEEIEEFVKGGGRVICLHQQETNFFSWLPKEVAIVNEVLDSKEVGAGVITFEDTESRIMNGISLFDLSPQYAPFPKWAKGYTGGAWTICSSPFIKDPLCQWDNGFKVLAGRHQKLQWWKATEIHNRAAILELNQGKGSYLMIQVPFEELLEKTQKARYVLSSMFTNMRIKLKQAPFITIRKDLISLDGNWLFKIDTGDIGLQQSWHKKDYDDTKWGIMGVPGPWETGIPLPDYDGYGWYRIHTLIPKEWEGKKIYLRVGRIDDCDWTYVNGHFAGSVTFTDAANGPYHNLTTPKGTNKKIEGGPYAVDREYEVPQEYIEFGKDNVIAVRVYDQKGHGGIFGGITDIRCEE